MKQLILIFSLPLFWSCALTTPLARESIKEAPPNIILIMADDMGFDCLKVNGSESYKTPVLDQLATEGMRFTQCFANPICTPSRVKIMTGLYNIRNYTQFGVLPRGETTFAHQLKKAGYATAIAGKWQLGKEFDSPQHFGFDQSCLWQHTRPRNRAKERRDSRFPNPQLEINGKPVDYSNGEYGPDVCADFLIDFIKANKDKPFLAYYPMILTHCPFDATPDSPNWDPKSLGSKSYKGPGGTAEQHQRFNEMVTYSDKLVGRIIKTLEETGLRENTLIIFTGDNGTDKPIVTKWKDAKGSRAVTGGKGKVHDTGTRVPFIANWPGRIVPGVNESELIEFSDILPTLCDVSSSPLPKGYPDDGVSLWPILSGKDQRNKDNIYIYYSRGGNSPGIAWSRTIDYGVLRDKTGKTKYQHFAGHFEEEDIQLDSVTEQVRSTLMNLEGRIDHLKTQKVLRPNKK